MSAIDVVRQELEDLAASLDEMRAAHSPTTTTTRRTP